MFIHKKVSLNESNTLEIIYTFKIQFTYLYRGSFEDGNYIMYYISNNH